MAEIHYLEITLKMPQEWMEAITSSIYKKGDKTVCENYRGIALLNVAYKVLATNITDKLTQRMDNIVREYQCGFQGRGMIDK